MNYYTFTRKTIIKAFWNLMKNEPFESITVTRICQYAGIGRSSFYRYFRSKEDIIVSEFNKLLEPLKNHVKKNRRPNIDTINKLVNAALNKVVRNKDQILYKNSPALLDLIEHCIANNDLTRLLTERLSEVWEVPKDQTVYTNEIVVSTIKSLLKICLSNNNNEMPKIVTGNIEWCMQLLQNARGK